MFRLFKSAHELVKEDTPNRLVLGLPDRLEVQGMAWLLIALIAGLATIRIGVVGVVIALLAGGWGLWLSTRRRSVTFDLAQQKVFFVTNHLLFGRKTRSIPFEDIAQVYLDFLEEAYAAGTDAYDPAERVRRRWAIFLNLGEGQTLTVAEAMTDHAVGDQSSLIDQSAYWERLAARIAKLTGKTLVRMPDVPGGPHTFVEAIDQILQRRLAETQLSGHRTVHLCSGTDGSLEVVVDGTVYGDLSKVDDKGVRDLIQASVDEWQNGSR
jgi:hypothetical protein